MDSVRVTFLVTTFNLDSNEDIFLTGNNLKLGNWQPSKVKLKRLNDSTLTKEILFSSGDELEFKFTRGDWSNEALDNNNKVPANHLLKVKNDTVVSFMITNWKDKIEIEIIGQITGNVKYIKNFKSEGIEPRDIIVWLPPSYDFLLDKSYPVIYMHDGQNIFDPRTSAFNIDWRLDETTDSLIAANEIEEIIIIGIYNTLNRYAEYSPNDTGYRYMNFIVKELKPFIDKNFRTNPDRKYTATGGSSMGGLISFMLAWEYSENFSMAACLSPAFLYRNFNYVDTVSDYNGNKKPIKLYIDNGGIGIENILQPGIDRMLRALLENGYRIDEDLIWYKDESADHSESAWAERSERFLKLFFEKK
jgi:predicted alpha/beta superfamily hydrolase